MLVPLTLIDLSDSLSDTQVASFALGHITGSKPVFFNGDRNGNAVFYSQPERSYTFHKIQSTTEREKFLPLLNSNPLEKEFYTLDPNYCYICFNIYRDHNAAEFYGWHRPNEKQRKATAVESALRPHLSISELNPMSVLVAVMKKLTTL